jgi:hypothetical protein
MKLSADHFRALALIAEAGPRGVPESILVDAHGFSIELLMRLIGDGLATAASERVKAGDRMIDEVRLTITDAGRAALAL